MEIGIIHEELMSIGRTGIIQDKGYLVDSFPVGSSHTYMLYDSERISKYSEEEIISLFKGLVIAEKELKWHIGSTSPATHLYQYISSRHFDRDNELATLAFEYSDNEYVPFGFRRHGERTANEYLQWSKYYQDRLIQEKLNAEERKRRKHTRSVEIKKEKDALDKKNRLEYDRINGLSTRDQVETILNDKVHNFLFFIPVIYRLLERADIATNDLESIPNRLEKLPSTPFNRRIIKRIESKINDQED